MFVLFGESYWNCRHRHQISTAAKLDSANVVSRLQSVRTEAADTEDPDDGLLPPSLPGLINQTCRPQSPDAKCGTRCQITTKVSSDVKLEAEPRGLCKGQQG